MWKSFYWCSGSNQAKQANMFWTLHQGVFVLVIGLLVLYLGVDAGRQVDSTIYCGACRALVNELDYAISKEDPRQTITVGSFRIDPDGKSKHTKIPYAGSEAHLSEVMETVCEKMTDYAEQTDPDTQEKSFVRFNSRDGEDMELNNVSINVQTGKRLQIACENIIEEHEDDILRLYRERSSGLETRLCSQATKLCEDRSSKHQEL